jgi:hypothetical protein
MHEMIVLFDRVDEAGVAIGAAGGQVPVPLTDIEEAKAYYVGELGFVEDSDLQPGDGVRLVRLAPRDSCASILLAARAR